jgi:putative DNA-invertase from lambdoid prophage Rac
MRPISGEAPHLPWPEAELPPYTQFAQVRDLLSQEAVGIARIAEETGLTRQTIYRIKDDPASSEAALAAWGL